VQHDDRDVLCLYGTGAVVVTLDNFAAHYNYFITIFLMISGLYIVIARGNMIKKLVGLSLFQTSVYLLYISPGKIIGGTPPILDKSDPTLVYSNPLPHVLILTAIVVGVATLALGLALVARIHEAYGTIEEDEIFEREEQE
jgi:multicomponent Na+:H+ antiporter subunit C